MAWLWALVGVLLVSVLWRLASRRHVLPCPAWLGWMVERENPLARACRADHIVRALALQPGMRVLDAGCGPGRVTLPLAQALAGAGEVTALDLQPAMLAQVERKAAARGIVGIRCVQGSLGDAPLPAAGYERAVLAAVLGEIPDRQAALTALAQHLRPGGRVAIAELVFDPHFQRQATVRALAARAGLREQACHGRAWAYVLVFEREQQ